MSKYNVEVQLTGRDSNAYNIMGSVINGLKSIDVPQEEIDKYVDEAKSGDYDNLLRVSMDWVEVL